MFRKITSPPLSVINSRLLVGLYWLSVGLFFSATAGAEQLKFKKAQSESGVLFSYEWLDMDSTRQSISFELPHTAIKAAPTQQANYRPKIAQRYVTVALMLLPVFLFQNGQCLHRFTLACMRIFGHGIFKGYNATGLGPLTRPVSWSETPCLRHSPFLYD